MPRVSRSGDGGTLRIAGVYERLLVREREKCSPRPQLLYPSTADQGQVYRRSRVLLDALEAGRTVTVPKYLLGGNTVRDERIRALTRRDRSITGWLVGPDDSVVPVRGGE